MNLVKTFHANTFLAIESQINHFLKQYDGELLQVQVIKSQDDKLYEAIISYKQSDPTK